MNHTFSESSGCPLLQDTIWDIFSFEKISGNGRFTKKRKFLAFFEAANQTILMPAGFAIPHLKGFAHYFSGNMSKMMLLLKFLVPTPSEVS